MEIELCLGAKYGSGCERTGPAALYDLLDLNGCFVGVPHLGMNLDSTGSGICVLEPVESCRGYEVFQWSRSVRDVGVASRAVCSLGALGDVRRGALLPDGFAVVD